MTELEYIIKQISKTNKKNFENYVVTRIWHGINKTDVKFTTQQFVNRPNGHALTDMYFPQFDLHIEIDEPFHNKQKELDLNRESDIIEATNHKIERVKITDDINFINKQIDSIINEISTLRKKSIDENTFEPWDLEKEYNPEYHREKGYLDTKENPAFKTISHACNCLGQNYKDGSQRSYVKSKVYENHNIWFPKFYNNDKWDNWISDDGLTIMEKCKTKSKQKEYFYSLMNSNVNRIVFPRSKDNLGFTLYRFKGIFKTDKENSSIENGIIHRRINNRIEIKK